MKIYDERVIFGHLDRRLPGEMRYEKIQCDILAVHEFVDRFADLRIHTVRVLIHVILVEKRRTR